MAPKAEKKPAQPAKKAVAGAGRKKGSKKAVESYKIYIYKVNTSLTAHTHRPLRIRELSLTILHTLNSEARCAGLKASPSRHWNFLQGHVHLELVHRRHI